MSRPIPRTEWTRRSSSGVSEPHCASAQRADARAKAKLGPGALETILAGIPDLWLEDQYRGADPVQARDTYRQYFEVRLADSHVFVEEAIRARAQLV